jgi:hypothetical protein
MIEEGFGLEVSQGRRRRREFESEEGRVEP